MGELLWDESPAVVLLRVDLDDVPIGIENVDLGKPAAPVALMRIVLNGS